MANTPSLSLPHPVVFLRDSLAYRGARSFSGSKREIPQNLGAVEGEIHRGPSRSSSRWRLGESRRERRELYLNDFGRSLRMVGPTVRVTRNRGPALSIFFSTDRPSDRLSLFLSFSRPSTPSLPVPAGFRYAVPDGLRHNPVGLLLSHNRC